MQTKIRAIRSGGSGEPVDLKSSIGGDLRVAQYLPQYAMLCAAGKVFSADTTGGTAAIPVVVPPTTSPEWGLYNANSAGGPSLVLLTAWLILESGTAGLGCALLLCSAIGAQTVVSSNASGTIISCLDGTTKTAQAYVASNPTLLGGAPSWVTAESYDQLANNGVGEGIVARVDGLVIAPPKGLIGLEVVAETGSTAKYDIGFIFAEVQLDLG